MMMMTLTPVLSPTIAHNPVLLPSLSVSAPTDNTDNVIDLERTFTGIEDAILILFKIRCVHSASNWTPRMDLGHHPARTDNFAILSNRRIGESIQCGTEAAIR